MRMQPTGSHFIDGGYLDDPAGTPIDNINPATGETIARVTAACADTVDRAVAAARQAQPAWAALPGRERGAVLRRAAELMRARNRALSELETLDTGKPLQETLVADAASGADNLAYFADVAATLAGETLELDQAHVHMQREPHGVCAGLGAWNYPIQIACWKAAPALACGNAMVFKPSELTPLSALKLAEILQEAGLPDGVFNVIQGGGETGAGLCGHAGVDKVSLTGSATTGRQVMAAAAETLTPVTLELGGKSPLIVFADADLDNAVGAAMLGNFYSSGQICSNGTRVFVEAPLHDAFLERLAARTAAIRIGDPLDEATQLGPLISRAQYDKVLDYMRLGVSEGARLVCGGGPVRLEQLPNGLFVAPTVFADVRDDMRIAREEIFGPVMSVFAFTAEDDVIARANATEFGLAAGVFSADLERARRVVGRLQAGTCWINAYNLTPVGMPFGGVKQSGFGRENAAAAVEHYSQIKSVYVAHGDVDAPY